MIEVLPAFRRAAGAAEMTVFGRNYRIVATSGEGTVGSIPELPERRRAAGAAARRPLCRG